MNSFLASGGDNFAVVPAEGTNKADSGKIDLESMVDWFEEFGTCDPGPHAARGGREPARRHGAWPPVHR